ncbi:MAG: DNA gyrase inhibitor YacG [Acidobacteria bacterium]|nr:MAG: DNA gyrase inhibitor YacG [Acidobacteriota bacterium]
MVRARVCVFCRREPAQAPWIPFCSERCKLQDLARWVDGDYRVPAEPVTQESEKNDDETDH